MTSYFDTVLQFLGFIVSPTAAIVVVILGMILALIHASDIPIWDQSKPFRVFFRITYIAVLLFAVPFVIWVCSTFYAYSWTVRS